MLYCGLFITTTNIIITRVYKYNDKYSELEEKYDGKILYVLNSKFFEENDLS